MVQPRSHQLAFRDVLDDAQHVTAAVVVPVRDGELPGQDRAGLAVAPGHRLCREDLDLASVQGFVVTPRKTVRIGRREGFRVGPADDGRTVPADQRLARAVVDHIAATRAHVLDEQAEGNGFHDAVQESLRPAHLVLGSLAFREVDDAGETHGPPVDAQGLRVGDDRNLAPVRPQVRPGPAPRIVEHGAVLY